MYAYPLTFWAYFKIPQNTTSTTLALEGLGGLNLAGVTKSECRAEVTGTKPIEAAVTSKAQNPSWRLTFDAVETNGKSNIADLKGSAIRFKSRLDNLMKLDALDVSGLSLMVFALSDQGIAVPYFGRNGFTGDCASWSGTIGPAESSDAIVCFWAGRGTYLAFEITANDGTFDLRAIK